jgi:hypothetical protein
MAYVRLISTTTASIPAPHLSLTRPLLYSSHTAFRIRVKKETVGDSIPNICRPLTVATSSERGSSVVVVLHHEPYLHHALSLVR